MLYLYCIFIYFFLGNLADLCDRFRQPITLVSKPFRRYEDHSLGCDIMFVVKESSSISGQRKISTTYNCVSHDLQQMHDYECMLYALLTNSNCKGYLFLPRDSRLFRNRKLRQNDRNRIWYGKRNNSKRLEVSLNNKLFFTSSEIAVCRKVFQELSLLYQIGFNNSKKYLRQWHKPWNVEIALNSLLWNGKGKFLCFHEEIETFYLPVRYKNVFIGMASIFKEVNMPNAIALPTILKSLDLESTFINIDST